MLVVLFPKLFENRLVSNTSHLLSLRFVEYSNMSHLLSRLPCLYPFRWVSRKPQHCNTVDSNLAFILPLPSWLMTKNNTFMSTIYYRHTCSLLSSNCYLVLWGLLSTLLKNKNVCFICFTSCLLRLLSNFDVHGWSMTEFADFITYILNTRELSYFITLRRVHV